MDIQVEIILVGGKKETSLVHENHLHDLELHKPENKNLRGENRVSCFFFCHLSYCVNRPLFFPDLFLSPIFSLAKLSILGPKQEVELSWVHSPCRKVRESDQPALSRDGRHGGGIPAHQTWEDVGQGWVYQLACSPPSTIKQCFPKNPELSRWSRIDGLNPIPRS